MSKKWLALALKFLVSGFLIWFLLSNIDLGAAKDRLLEVDPAMLAFALLVFFVQPVIGGFRWEAVLTAIGKPLGLGKSYQLFYIGSFFNQTLPSSVGGDAVRMYKAYRHGLGLRAAVNGVVLERAVTVVALVVLVDATTLKPISVRREISRQATTVTGEYDSEEGIIRITIIDKDGDERPVPLRLEEHYYDNESSLFLWRTIRFEEGYEASYYSVLANQRSHKLVTVRVAGTEEVTVPAGTFQTWRVEIRFDGTKQVAWYADTPERTLVQYDNSRQLMQLTPSAAN